MRTPTKESDEITIEEIVIVSIIETVLEEADKVIEIEETSVELAVLEAAERVDEFIVDPSIEAIREAVDRVDEEANEIIVEKIIINSIIEATIDKIARGEAVYDNTAEERVEEFTVEPSDEAILEATEESRDPGSNPNRSKTIDCL